MKALAINCSEDYNLATAKIAAWLRRQGHHVKKLPNKSAIAQNPTESTNGYDAVFLSALYTWDLPLLVDEAQKALPYSRIEIGGPAASIMPDYVFERTGVRPVIGLDERFESEPARYLSTHTSRGCIRHCAFCSVPDIEGDLREKQDFVAAPYVLDANILACSRDHIESVCEKFSHLPMVDFLHGLDARLVKPWQVELLSRKLKMPVWRFTFDSLRHEAQLTNTLDLLREYGIKPEEKVIIYCLCGYNDDPRNAYERARRIMNLGAHPYAMRFQPLDALIKDQFLCTGWDVKTMREFWDFCNTPTMAWLYEQIRPKR
jgi:hypothetical protein